MKLRTSLLAIGGIGGGLALYNRRLEMSGGQLPNRLGGEVCYYRWRGGDLAYSVAGDGEPLLLVHGVYAGASSFEFRKNFEELSKSFRVYALNLLGCGLSERPSRRYEPEDVALQIEDFVREEIGGPAHLVASSLTAALVMPAVVRSGQLFQKLVLICPTGYGILDRPSGRLGDVIYGLFLAPILGNTLLSGEHGLPRCRSRYRRAGRGLLQHCSPAWGEILPCGLRLRQAQPRGRRPLDAGAAQDPHLLGPRSAYGPCPRSAAFRGEQPPL